MKRPFDHRFLRTRAARQRGVVLLFSLIALVVLLIAAAALMRSFNTSLFMAGNIAFKRDLQNQGERAIDTVKNEFLTGVLNSPTTRAADQPQYNYSAQMLDVNQEGVPLDLALSDTNFISKWQAGDVAGSDTSVSTRYVVDRMCSGPGLLATLGPTACVIAGSGLPLGGSSNNQNGAAAGGGGNAGAAQQAVVYRVSIRVSGPRNTQAFFQSTIAVP